MEAERRRVHLDANAEVTRLRQAAEVIRRYSGELKYHPATGLANPPAGDFDQALLAMGESLARIEGWRSLLEEELQELGLRGESLAVQEALACHRHVEEFARLLRGSIEVLRATMRNPERAPLDAPYGFGAPRRPHPGAQATWVAERSDGLARELGYLILLIENLSP